MTALAPKTRAEEVFLHGFADGLADRHWVRRNYRSSAEWISWLRGWRAGQIELKNQRAFAELQQAREAQAEAPVAGAAAVRLGQQASYVNRKGFLKAQAHASAWQRRASR